MTVKNDSKAGERGAVQQPLLQQMTIEDENPPKDRFFIVYVIVLLFGVATLLPWNIFITATSVTTKAHLLNLKSQFF